MSPRQSGFGFLGRKTLNTDPTGPFQHPVLPAFEGVYAVHALGAVIIHLVQIFDDPPPGQEYDGM